MAQSYTAITSDSLLIDAPATLGDNFDTLFTSQSGANAPLSPEEGNLWLKVGTPSALYVYKNGAWSVIPDGDDTTKQNQNSRLDAIADADAVESSSFIPVYSSDSVVTFREAGTSGLSILQSASAAGATFVNQASLDASAGERGLVGLAKTTGDIDSSHVKYTGNLINGNAVITSGHLKRRTYSHSEIDTNISISIGHSLGSIPAWFRLVAVCKQASHSYTVGDEVTVLLGYGDNPIVLGAGAGFIHLRTYGDVYIASRQFGTYVNIYNDTKWKLKVYAGL